MADLSENPRARLHCGQTARKLIGRFHPLPVWSICVAGAPQMLQTPPSRATTCSITRFGTIVCRSGNPPPCKLHKAWPIPFCRSESKIVPSAIAFRTWRTKAASARQCSLQYGERSDVASAPQFGQV